MLVIYTIRGFVANINVNRHLRLRLGPDITFGNHMAIGMGINRDIFLGVTSLRRFISI